MNDFTYNCKLKKHTENIIFIIVISKVFINKVLISIVVGWNLEDYP